MKATINIDSFLLNISVDAWGCIMWHSTFHVVHLECITINMDENIDKIWKKKKKKIIDTNFKIQNSIKILGQLAGKP